MHGFITALGTPLDQNGIFFESSFRQQIIDQVAYQAAGLLVMGSMGLGVFVRSCDYVKVVATAVDATRGHCPVFVGVTDTSVGRTCERIDAIVDLAIDGVVATPPYYYCASEQELIVFYRELSRRSRFPLYLYDLPVAARSKITLATIEGLQGEGNIKGIKTADMPLALALQQRIGTQLPEDFRVLYSGLDTFDAAYAHGITCHLDGMLACTAPLASRMYQALAGGFSAEGTRILREIISLRDVFARESIFPSFTVAMNLLGYAGCFHPDYYLMPSRAQTDLIRQTMQALDLIGTT
jgi:4-hydroxy-tetrahydrodipicolinate synthase